MFYSTQNWKRKRLLIYAHGGLVGKNDARQRRRPEGFLDGALDFVLARLDDFLEPVARSVGGRSLWQEMKGNARLATETAGAWCSATS
ncbi:hypothetical protein [Hymenobacter sp.]|uniref:hypothetical protein n=1 Tax=Hymenobacter sp. TaxID=1898978 RepID=UPI00286C499C|nr:hypothetical protein [Hymenobacter sp.]